MNRKHYYDLRRRYRCLMLRYNSDDENAYFDEATGYVKFVSW